MGRALPGRAARGRAHRHHPRGAGRDHPGRKASDPGTERLPVFRARVPGPGRGPSRRAQGRRRSDGRPQRARPRPGDVASLRSQRVRRRDRPRGLVRPRQRSGPPADKSRHPGTVPSRFNLQDRHHGHDHGTGRRPAHPDVHVPGLVEQAGLADDLLAQEWARDDRPGHGADRLLQRHLLPGRVRPELYRHRRPAQLCAFLWLGRTDRAWTDHRRRLGSPRGGQRSRAGRRLEAPGL